MASAASQITLRRVETKPRQGNVVAFVAGRGGVGKTNVALNVGAWLAQREARVALLDADTQAAGAYLLLRAPPSAVAEAGSGNLRTVRVAGPGGLCVVRFDAQRERRAPDFERTLAHWRGGFDTLIVNGPSTMDSDAGLWARAADLLVLVITPEPAALVGGYALLKSLPGTGLGGRVGVVVNMARARPEAAAAAARLIEAARRFLGLSVENLGCIPWDAHVPRAVRRRIPFVTCHAHCCASSGVAAVCERIHPAQPPVAVGAGVWSRVASLFL